MEIDINQILSIFSPEQLNIALKVLALIGGVDVILGVVSKWTPWKWDDNLYSILHEAVVRFPELLNKGK